MKPIRRNELANLVVFMAVVLGAFIRFAPASLAGFAINDGGMFAVMVDDLKTSGYALPVFTSYNGLNIPFAYPPLGFYFGRIAADLLRLSTVDVLRWLPAFFASLSIPAFFLLASRLMKTRFHAALATLIFSLMPRAFSWFVEGGGLTRSPAQLFMLLTFFFVLRLYSENRRQDVLWSGLFGGLTVLSHPETAMHTLFLAVFFWLMLGRSRRSFSNSVQVAILVLIVAAPWWMTVITRHGLAPLLSAAQTGQKLLAVFNLVFFSFTEEPYATFIAVLGLIGLGYYLVRKDYFFPLWLVLPFFVEGRSAILPAAIPLAMLAASGFVDVVLATIRSARTGQSPPELVSRAESWIIAYLLLYLLFSAYQFDWDISSVVVSDPDQQAMIWVRKNTPENARFIVLTGTHSISFDPVPEWFPALARRKSLFTVQGQEWLLGNSFGNAAQKSGALQSCVSISADCVLNMFEPDSYDYIYFSRILHSDNFKPLIPPLTFPYAIEGLRTNTKLKVVYETADVIIYQKNNQ